MLVDVEDTGALDLVIVDGGSIIFPCEPEYASHLSKDLPRPARKFDASYIFIHEGLF